MMMIDMKMSLLSFIPHDVFATIIFEWMHDMTDLVKLDTALAQKSVRAEFLSLLDENQSRTAKPHMKLLVHNKDIMKSVIVWKELRRYHKISELNLRFTPDQSLDLHFAQSLKVLSITFYLLCVPDAATFLLRIFANFPVLETFKFSGMMKMRWKMVTTKVVRPCKLKSLIFNSTYFDRESPESDRWDVYEWIAKCCPELEDLSLMQHITIPAQVVTNMLITLPKLKRFHYTPKSCPENGIILSPHDQHIYLDEVRLTAWDKASRNIHSSYLIHLMHFIRNVKIFSLRCSFYSRDLMSSMNAWFKQNGEYLLDLTYDCYVVDHLVAEILNLNPVAQYCTNLEKLTLEFNIPPNMFANFQQAACRHTLQELSFHEIVTLYDADIDTICNTVLPQMKSVTKRPNPIQHVI
jgi:hypothetical protein